MSVKNRRGTEARPSISQYDCHTAKSDGCNDILNEIAGQFPQGLGREARIKLERAIAQAFVRQIGGHCWEGKDEMVRRVHEQIVRHNPKTEITIRRVRAFWHQEASHIGFAEMLELVAVASFVTRGGNAVSR